MSASSSHETCPQCALGVLKPVQAAFTGVLRGTFVSVPEMDALQCDVCGYREFSGAALQRLETLLGELPPTAEPARPSSKRQPGDPDVLDRPRGSRIKP